MMSARKAQVEPLTAALITGLVLATVTGVYVWGSPLLDKRDAEADLVGLENEVIEIYNSIFSIQESGQDASTVLEMDFSEETQLTISEGENSLIIESEAEESVYPGDARFTLLGGIGEVDPETGDDIEYGIEGIDEPGTVMVDTVSAAESQIIEYEMTFNKLYTQTQQGEILRETKIETTDEGMMGQGEMELVMTNKGVEVEEEGETLSSGQVVDLHRHIVEIIVQ